MSRIRNNLLLSYPPDIKLMRADLHLTRAGFAKLFCISEETVKSWETGRRNPHMAFIAAATLYIDSIYIKRYSQDITRPITDEYIWLSKEYQEHVDVTPIRRMPSTEKYPLA